MVLGMSTHKYQNVQIRPKNSFYTSCDGPQPFLTSLCKAHLNGMNFCGTFMVVDFGRFLTFFEKSLEFIPRPSEYSASVSILFPGIDLP